MRGKSLLIEELPQPAAVHRELGRVLRKAVILRRLLKLSIAEQERRANDPMTVDRDDAPEASGAPPALA